MSSSGPSLSLDDDCQAQAQVQELTIYCQAQTPSQSVGVVMFRLCMGTHFATCDHDAVHKICARSATRYTLLILLPRPGTHFNI